MSLFGLRLGTWRLRSAIEALKGAVDEHSKAISSTQAANRNPPSTVQTVNAVVAFDNETKTDTETENNRQYGVQDSIRWAAWCAFGAAFVYAGIATYQSCLIRKQIENSAESFRIDERAWVELEPIKPMLVAPEDKNFGAMFTCDIYPKNVGKTVARDIDARAANVMSVDGWDENADVVSRAQDTMFSDPSLNSVLVSHIPAVIAPNSVSPVPFRNGCQAPRAFPNGHMEMHYLIGRVNYCDQFNVKHWLRFCFYIGTAKGEIWACKQGNYEDRNGENPKPDTACGKPN
jgi:hypothetical protein